MAGSQDSTGAPEGERDPAGDARTFTIATMPWFRMVRGVGRDFWAIDPPAGFDAACAYGARRACDLLRLTPAAGEPAGWLEQAMRWIALAQVRRGIATEGDRGALVGFHGVIGALLATRAGPAAASRIEARLAALEAFGHARLVELYGAEAAEELRPQQ